MDFPKVIDILAEFFEREKIPFAVVGAFALHAYGLTRATTDLDFVTDSTGQQRLRCRSRGDSVILRGRWVCGSLRGPRKNDLIA